METLSFSPLMRQTSDYRTSSNTSKAAVATEAQVVRRTPSELHSPHTVRFITDTPYVVSPLPAPAPRSYTGGSNSSCLLRRLRVRYLARM